VSLGLAAAAGDLRLCVASPWDALALPLGWRCITIKMVMMNVSKIQSYSFDKP